MSGRLPVRRKGAVNLADSVFGTEESEAGVEEALTLELRVRIPVRIANRERTGGLGRRGGHAPGSSVPRILPASQANSTRAATPASASV
jgi:hypothetical protein